MSELQDRYDIGQVIVRFATSGDQRDLERYATCFTDDVVVTGFSGGAFEDRDVYVAWVGDALSKYAGTHHQITNRRSPSTATPPTCAATCRPPMSSRRAVTRS